MIYLVLEMFVYLAAALGIGVAAGWLWRHRDAATQEAALERRLIDQDHRVPRLQAELADYHQRQEGVEQALAEAELRIRQQAELLVERDERIAELLDAQHREAEARAALEPAGAPQRVDDSARAELQQRLDGAERALALAQRRIDELGRERALQARALKAMEQQLEMARERTAGTGRAAGLKTGGGAG